MKKIRKAASEFFAENKYIVLILGISCLVIFSSFIFFDKPFVFDADQQNQYHVFYREWIEMINNFFASGELPMWSWNSFLGMDFYSAQSYYVTGDIFLPLIMLFESVEIGLLIETMILVVLSGITMNLFLKESGITTKRNRNFISIVYALSGTAVLFFGQYIFHRFYAFTPLLFYGLELYLNSGRGVTFVLSTTLLFVTNYYFMFQTSVFILMFGIFTTINRRMDAKKIVTSGLKLLILYLMGMLISGIISIPSILYLLGNPRVGSISNTGLFWNIKTYLGFMLNAIAPYFSGYLKLFFVNLDCHDSWYSLFIGFVPLVLAYSLLFSKKYKNYSRFLYILIFIMLLKPLSSVMHGFSEPSLRWTCLLVFYLLLMAAKSLDDNVKIDRNAFIFPTASAIIAILIGFLVGSFNLTFSGHIYHIILSGIIGVITYIVYRKNPKVAMILTIIHLIINPLFALNYLNREYYRYDETINKSYIEYYRNIDDDLMFRMYVNSKHLFPSSDMNLNKSLDYNYMSITSYNTVFDNNISDFIGMNKDVGGHLLPLSSPDIMTTLGVKYYMVYSEDELPGSIDFEYAYSLEHLKVYKNLDFKGFGYSTDSVKKFSEYGGLKDFETSVC